MIHRVWILETDGGDTEVFLNLEDARDFAYKTLIEWGYDPENDDCDVFKELDESYNNKGYSGFWVDELLWCSEANYHY
jgi:hypothetical protein